MSLFKFWFFDFFSILKDQIGSNVFLDIIKGVSCADTILF